MNIITRDRYDRLTELARAQSRLWQNADERWEYHAAAAGIVRQIAKDKPDLDVLEIGSHGVQIVEGSTTVDVANNVWPYPARPDFDMDITRTPWPFYSGQFDVCIALRVWQHLGLDQEACFREACRAAEHVIIAAPPEYVSGYGVDLATIRKWIQDTAQKSIASTLCTATNTAVYWIAP